ncbi:MAG: PHP domain-containing protein [Lachnospiraceae bacterium]|nr:PHP domain-containing protein [Lachnospiraceae bacterium]
MVDLHIHSRASDGSDSIKELLEKVRGAGISVFSLTDHDTIDGISEMEKMVPDDMRFIRGIEFTSITEAGKCHILGYDYDSCSEDFCAILKESIRHRKNKTEKRIAFLESEFGISLTEEELSDIRGKSSVEKPYFGNLLVSKGYAKDKKEAIKKYLDPCKTDDYRLEGRRVIEAILAAGGIPVWAHPFGGTDEDEVSVPDFEKQLKVLTKAGLRGLECYYSKYTKEQVEMLLGFAEENGLCVSGGSDYHGKNKKVALGTLNAFGMKVTEDKLTVLDAIMSQ